MPSATQKTTPEPETPREINLNPIEINLNMAVRMYQAKLAAHSQWQLYKDAADQLEREYWARHKDYTSFKEDANLNYQDIADRIREMPSV